MLRCEIQTLTQVLAAHGVQGLDWETRRASGSDVRRIRALVGCESASGQRFTERHMEGLVWATGSDQTVFPPHGLEFGPDIVPVANRGCKFLQTIPLHRGSTGGGAQMPGFISVTGPSNRVLGYGVT